MRRLAANALGLATAIAISLMLTSALHTHARERAQDASRDRDSASTGNRKLDRHAGAFAPYYGRLQIAPERIIRLPAVYTDSAPRGDELVERQCGPLASWEVLDVRTNADAEAVSSLVRDRDVRVRVHWKPTPYPPIVVKRGACIKVEGVRGSDGELPLVAGVNAARAYNGRDIRRGGLWIESLDISPGKALTLDPSLDVRKGDCIGVPNDQMFLIVRDSEITRCGHHALLVGHAHHIYVELRDSHFEQASSHLVYIQHAGLAVIENVTAQSPGNGHALRCIALKCEISHTRVSNVQLDGTVLPRGGSNPLQPKRIYIGMAPLEVYTCGEHTLTDIEATFYTSASNGGHAAILRARPALRTCDVGEVDNSEWTRLIAGTRDHDDPARWDRVTPLVTTVERMRVRCLGERACSGWDVQGTYPLMTPEEAGELRSWLRAGDFSDWSVMLDSIPIEHPEWLATAALVRPQRRASWAQGTTGNRIPLAIVEGTWRQRAQIDLVDVTVEGGTLLRPGVIPEGASAPVHADSDGNYCYGLAPGADGNCTQQRDGARYRQAIVHVRASASDRDRDRLHDRPQ